MSQSTLESVGAEVESKIAAAENEVAAAKAEVAGAKAQLAEAKERLVKAEDVLGKAEEAAPVDAQRVAKAELGVAKAELGVAEAKLGVAKAELGVAKAELGVAEAKWQAAPDNSNKAIVLAKSVKTAQESVTMAQKIVTTANMAYEKALGVPTATPQHGAAGGDQAASGQGAVGGGAAGVQGTVVGSVDTRVLEMLERLEQDRHVERELLMTRLERFVIQTDPASSPSTCRLGNEQRSTLVATNRWNVVQGPGSPVLSFELAASRPATTCTESELIRWFTPHLNRLVQIASTRVGPPLVLVNSERHRWVQDSSLLGAPSNPDMFVCHPAFFKSNKSAGDSAFDGADFHFGDLAHWDLRDSVVAIVEWKSRIGPDDNSALGEGVEYSRRIMHTGNNTSVPLDDPMVRITRVILADRDTFYLVLCQSGVAIECDWGMWTDAGSEDAIIKFIQNGASPRRWVDAISSLCFEFNVTLVHDIDNPCFLGRGACGRVFRVRTIDGGCECALKVVLDDSRCSMVLEESYNYESSKDQLAGLGCVVTISRIFKSPDRKFAGLLSSPVGVPCQRIKMNIVSAVMGLKSLALSGFRHGDARWPNVVIHQAKAVWLDLRTLHRVGDNDNVDLSFTADLKTFVDSLGGNVDSQMLLRHANGFLKSGDENHHLLMNELSCLWRSA